MLQRETCEILFQIETITDLSFDMARIQEGAGLGFADDVPECAFPASKLACLRSIESINEGYLSVVKDVFSYPAGLQEPGIPLPGRQLASALLAVNSTFLEDERGAAECKDLRKLRGRFLRASSEREAHGRRRSSASG